MLKNRVRAASAVDVLAHRAFRNAPATFCRCILIPLWPLDAQYTANTDNPSAIFHLMWLRSPAGAQLRSKDHTTVICEDRFICLHNIPLYTIRITHKTLFKLCLRPSRINKGCYTILCPFYFELNCLIQYDCCTAKID